MTVAASQPPTDSSPDTQAQQGRRIHLMAGCSGQRDCTKRVKRMSHLATETWGEAQLRNLAPSLKPRSWSRASTPGLSLWKLFPRIRDGGKLPYFLLGPAVTPHQNSQRQRVEHDRHRTPAGLHDDGKWNKRKHPAPTHRRVEAGEA
ncbi:hypothetical protein L345_07837, partial [Ophiophagus hannah]